MQMSLFSDPAPASQSSVRLPLPDADVQYYPRWLTQAQATALQHELETTLPWRQDTVHLFGKTMPIPRLQSWHGDPGCEYGYSGMRLSPSAWTEALTTLRERCQRTTGCPFNSVLANWYRDGADSMSLHADDEPELGPDPVIASVSLGEARPFIFKHKHSKERITQVLEHGSLLVMGHGTQAHYLHGINKSRKLLSSRINLTFRYLR
ncbi:alpha-ketoglutarate-dependent dioxygenase AlkB family protein [Alteromonas halophila]|uniref:DNA methylase n=1 Tax=Alteromonas halophila TaxID=516698 RepID=A0A918JIH2_9ALTE|nr:alpha-ketoglutarate-dependent dioxygenase AlkB [Alteromonas halophila]GGW80283.1 DNA methylase [Alteromonas halophila]